MILFVTNLFEKDRWQMLWDLNSLLLFLLKFILAFEKIFCKAQALVQTVTDCISESSVIVAMSPLCQSSPKHHQPPTDRYNQLSNRKAFLFCCLINICMSQNDKLAPRFHFACATCFRGGLGWLGRTACENRKLYNDCPVACSQCKLCIMQCQVRRSMQTCIFHQVARILHCYIMH